MGSTEKEIAALKKEYPVLFNNAEPTAPSIDREAQLTVSIRQPFAVGRTHVTRAEFAAFVQATGHNLNGGCYTPISNQQSGWKLDANRSWESPGFEQNDRHPVVCLSFHDAQSYVKWISVQTGKPYRLLSEAEAEYGARGTSTLAVLPTRYFFGNNPTELCAYGNGADEIFTKTFNVKLRAAVPCRDGHATTAPASSFKPNPFGLHDVHGNVWTWTEDCWNESNSGNPGDGTARTTTGDCSRRVIRGGSWYHDVSSLRSAFRFRETAGSRSFSTGFRVARTL